ncbi:MAG: glycine cleavage system protein GcvH [Oscillospiraceae bacterium]|nr:glycine cleavage system protein GcvH [Oscillospiraceae bacterium]
MEYPKYLSYSSTHEWVEDLGDNKARIGISDFAQHSMGDIVFVNLPEVGDELLSGESFGDVESVKAVSELYSPFSGKVSAINEQLLDSPELINEKPYESWMLEMEDISDSEELLDADAYEALCDSEEH